MGTESIWEPGLSPEVSHAQRHRRQASSREASALHPQNRASKLVWFVQWNLMSRCTGACAYAHTDLHLPPGTQRVARACRLSLTIRKQQAHLPHCWLTLSQGRR